MKLRYRIPDIILTLFCVFWLLIIVGDYINKHPFYKFSYLYFRFQNLILFITVFSVAVSTGMYYWPRFKRWISTGLGLSAILLIFLVALTVSFSKYVPDFKLNSEHLLSFVGINMMALLYLLGLVISAYLYGKLFRLKFLNLPVYNVGLGIIVVCSLIFILAAFNVYNTISAAIVLLIPFVLLIKKLPALVYNILLGEIKIEKLNIWGGVFLCFTLFFLVMNFAHIQGPFPVGFDSRNFYMNIARQVSLSEGLIYGFRPYNWALLLSLGYVLFSSSSLAVATSFLGFLLSLVVIYRLGTKGLKIKENKMLFVLLVLTVTPAITNQLYIELKTDLGLLFFQTLAVLFLIRILLSKGFNKVIKSDVNIPFKLPGNLSKLAVLGLFLGFGLSIKLTNMFLVFAVVIALFWIISENKWVIASIILVTIVVFMVAGLDKLTGLHEYHLSRTPLIAALAIMAIFSIGYSYSKARIKVMNGVKITVLLAMFSSIPLLPWIVKNYNDTKSLNPSELLNGAMAGPKVNLNTLHRNYINSLDK